MTCPAILLQDAPELFRLKEVIWYATNAVIRSQDGHNPSQGIENSIRENKLPGSTFGVRGEMQQR